MIALLIVPGILLAMGAGMSLRLGLDDNSPGFIILGVIMFVASVFCNSAGLGAL